MYMETTDKDKESKTKIIKPQPGFQEKFVCSNVDVVFGGGILSCGKAQPLHSKILTPNGWTTMGALNVGDEIVGLDGKPQKIMNIFERGLLDNIMFTFEDNTSVECCPEHLWTVWDKHNKEYVTLEAQHVINNGIKRYGLPLLHPIEFNDNKDLPIDPYLLGVLLGDGMLGRDKASVMLTTDEYIVNKVSKENNITVARDKSKKNPSYRILGSKLRESLRNMGLFGKCSHEKFIPNEYLFSTIDNRLKLLQGLFDTDGYNDKVASRIEYCTTSEKLVEDVLFLVKSLGGKAKVITKIGSYKKNDKRVICKKAWRLLCKFENPNDMFTLERKRNGKISKRGFSIGITKVEAKGKEIMRCILVSNKDHLYVTDGLNLTHNTFAAILSVAEPSLDPSFRACFTRRTFGELNMGGGLVDDFESSYGNGAQIRKTNPPRVTFPSGSFVEMRQINDENIKKITEQWKGAQFDLIYMDELTSYQFSTFKYLLTRNRGKGSWTGKFRGTTNPKKDSWIRKFLDWYISPEGQIIPERDGVVRYFYIAGDTIDDVIWGDTKKEVYQKCKLDIDKKIKAVGGTISYENFIKSFTFYLGRMSENKAILDGNMDYVGSVAASGGRMAQQLLEGNWNVDLEDESDAPIPSHVARSTFMNDPQRNGDRWITCDLADFGTDNMVALAWDGFHIMDALILGKTTPRMNADKLSLFAAKWDVADCHIIYDGINGRYLSDYIPDAIAFLSFKAPRGMYGRSARSLKDECYLRLKYIINNRYLSWEEEVLQRRYTHNKMKDEITIGVEFVEECTVVRFKTEASGKHRLATKKEMNQMLGKGRSMDLLDPCAMRMYPVLEYQYGDELIETAVDFEEREKQYIPKDNIYRDDFWA